MSTDRAAVGRANQLNGRAAQDYVFKILGVEVKFRGQKGNEETWTESPHVPGFRWEVKRTSKMPALFKRAMSQIMATRAIGSWFNPAVAVFDAETNKVYAVVELEALVETCKSLAEVGQGSKIKSLARDAERIIREIQEAAR